jgi:thiol-disulfide isomerase/thioredoxin
MSGRIAFFLGLVVLAIVVARELVPERSVSGPAIGAPAPDFAAVAVDGRMIRLSELRGKVVVLDFWATWCGPCRRMIPHERELVKKHSSDPFAFLGISLDDDLAELRRVLSAEKMFWPTIRDDRREIAKHYDVHAMPTIYVLDRAGVIRFKDVRGADLDQAVAGLLAERK